MKVALVLSANIKFSPYVKYYIDYFKKNNINYEIISWNRAAINEENKNSYNVAHVEKNTKINQLIKYVKYIGYKNFVLKKIKKNSYDGIIVFTIQVAYLLKKCLLTSYKNKYIFDIRDYSNLVKKKSDTINELLMNSYQNIVSSMGFNSFLNSNVLICHNTDYNRVVQNINNVKFTQQINYPIKISSIGSFLEFNENAKLLKKLENSNKFQFYYIGNDTPHKENLKKFVTKEGLENVNFVGTYSIDNILNIYSEYCDFVNIIREDSVINKHAIPNKFYDGVLYGKPLITNECNCEISSLITKNGLGIVLSNNYTLYELITKIENFNYEQFQLNRLSFLNSVVIDQKLFESKINDFCIYVKGE